MNKINCKKNPLSKVTIENILFIIEYSTKAKNKDFEKLLKLQLSFQFYILIDSFLVKINNTRNNYRNGRVFLY